MKTIKTITTKTHTINLYNQPLKGGESINMNGRQYWMVRINNEFVNSTINRRKEVNGNYKPSHKCCNNCGETKLTEYNFYTSTYNKDGYQNICKQCVKVKAKKYREELELVA